MIAGYTTKAAADSTVRRHVAFSLRRTSPVDSGLRFVRNCRLPHRLWVSEAFQAAALVRLLTYAPGKPRGPAVTSYSNVSTGDQKKARQSIEIQERLRPHLETARYTLGVIQGDRARARHNFGHCSLLDIQDFGELGLSHAAGFDNGLKQFKAS